MNDSISYQSVFSWRYGSEDMRRIWSEEHKRRLWRQVWVALAQAQHEAGLVSADQVADLQAHAGDINLARAAEIEVEIRHDLMAEIRVFAEQCKLGGAVIHLGATSADIQENTDALRLRAGLDLLLAGLEALLAVLAARIEQWADMACMGFTHLQPAEPTTAGYRLALYGQDLLHDLLTLRRVRAALRGKGIKGAVGTSASYAQLLTATGISPAQLERSVMATLGLEAYPVTSQISPRRQDWDILNALAGIASSVHKAAFDIRFLQSPSVGEWAEPFGSHQVGSSAMPFKRNPIKAENLNSLARLVASLPRVAWDNAALTLLERTLDDSANRRVILPQAFLATDHLLDSLRQIIEDLHIDEAALARNLATYGGFAASERVLVELVKAGADRQTMHELLRQHSLAAWQSVRSGSNNPLGDLLVADAQLLEYLPAGDIRALMDASRYTGDAPERARTMAQTIRREIPT